MRKIIAVLAAIGAVAACQDTDGSRESLGPSLRADAQELNTNFALVSTIAFSSTRDDPTNPNPARVPEIS